MSDQELPPKKGSADRLITISEEVEKAVNGQKSSVRRNARYADVGDMFTLKDRQFKVLKVYSQSLGELTDSDAQKEGFSNLQEYKESILSLHPGMPWVPSMRVWVHEFLPV